MREINGISELQLVELVKLGDQLAFKQLFNYYYPGLVLYADQFTASNSQSEEIVQDFFVRLWERHHALRPAGSVKSYLFTSVRNGCLNYLRHQRVKSDYIRELEDLSQTHLLYDPDLYVASELQEKITQAIGKLPDRCREVFIMSRMEGMNNEDIACQLGISKRTVETQISKALKILRTELKDYLGLLFFLSLGNF